MKQEEKSELNYLVMDDTRLGLVDEKSLEFSEEEQQEIDKIFRECYESVFSEPFTK